MAVPENFRLMVIVEDNPLGFSITRIHSLKDFDFIRKNAMINEDKMNEKTFDIVCKLPTQIKNLTLKLY